MKADAVKIKDNVYWVDVLYWDLRSYHGYTLNGTTCNAYLVFGKDKTVLIDNTYLGTASGMWGRIEDELDIGGKKLAFLEAPLLHWHDSMFNCL